MTVRVRLPVLLTNGDPLTDVGCADLEIAMYNLFGDLKNVNSIISDMVPGQIES